MTANVCPVCKLCPRDQHSNRQSSLCDGLKSGKLRQMADGAIVEASSQRVLVAPTRHP